MAGTKQFFALRSTITLNESNQSENQNDILISQMTTKKTKPTTHFFNQPVLMTSGVPLLIKK